MGTQLPSPKKEQRPPVFGPFLLWPNDWMHQDATWYGGRLQPRGLCVRWGPSPHYRKRGRNPQFSAHVYCGQTAAWTKMPLGTEVGPDDIVLDGDPAAPLPKRGGPPNFRPILLWPNGWMHRGATWYGGRPRPRRLYVRWAPSPSLKWANLPNFLPTSVVAK